MPFDGVGSPCYEHLEKLDKVIALLETPDRWCKGAERNPGGQYCIRGALIAVDAWDSLRPSILHAVQEVSGGQFRRIEEFNDHPLTTHQDVLVALYRTRDDLLAGKFIPPVATIMLRRPAPLLRHRIANAWHRFFG